MIDMRDPRGIITFIVRYLALQLGLLVLLVFSFSSGFVLLTLICLLGFFTFFQVLASISPDFLDRAGFWKPIVISVTVLTYVPILWWFGRLVSGIAGSGSDWWLVISWLPFHFVAAFFAWGLRETIREQALKIQLYPVPLPAPLSPATARTPPAPKTQMEE